jgi:hypothetical protein
MGFWGRIGETAILVQENSQRQQRDHFHCAALAVSVSGALLNSAIYFLRYGECSEWAKTTATRYSFRYSGVFAGLPTAGKLLI